MVRDATLFISTGGRAFGIGKRRAESKRSIRWRGAGESQASEVPVVFGEGK